MAIKLFLRSWGLCCLLFFVFVAHGVSATLQDVLKDMQPLEAYAVDVVDGQVILDVGSEAGVVKNDLFTVFRAGRKLTDPKTGKVLGQIETRAGLVSITRVEKAFSYARSAGKTGQVKRGDKLVRFKEITSHLQDDSAGNSTFAFELKRGLQSLVWQNRKTAATELFFVRDMNTTSLTVKDKQGTVVRQYQLDSQPVVHNVATEKSSQAYAPVFTTTAATTVATTTAPAAAMQKPANKKVRYDMETYGYSQGLGLPFSAVMGDFLTIGNQLYLAVVREHEVAVYAVHEKTVEQVASVKTPLVKLLAVSWWQPAQGGSYVAVSGYDNDEDQVSSALYRFQDDRLAAVEDGLDFMLGASDIDGNGQPETLLAQEFDRDTFFGRTVKKITLSGDAIRFNAMSGKVPASFRVTGGAVLDNGESSVFILGNRLHVNVSGREVYTSGKEMGGSLSSVRYVINPDDINPLFSNAKIEVSPISADIDGDGNREILIPSADLSAFTTVGGANSIKKTWVSVLKKTDNGTWMKGKVGGEYDQYIQAMGVTDGALYLLTVNPSGILSDAQGGSQLLVLPLK